MNLDYTMYKEWFDVICSIGFTMYLEKDEDVQKLFDGFYIALKKDGVLITNSVPRRMSTTRSRSIK